MKKISGLAVCLAAMMCNFVYGDVVFFDNFDYPDGPLPAPWALHSGTGGQTIVNNQLLIDDAGTGDYNRGFSSVTSGWLYAGFDLNVSATDLPSSGNGQYFAHFGQETTGQNANFVSRVFLATGTNGSDFNIGIARGSGTGATTTFLQGTFLAGTTYRIVHGYDMDNNTAILAVNSPDGSTAVSSNNGTTDPVSLNFFAFRIATGGSDGDKLIDNLVVATTYSQAFTAVPEPSALLLVGSVLGAGFLRRRRS